MQTPNLSYLPKQHSLSCKEFTRQTGHIPVSIHMHDHQELMLVDTHATCRITNNGCTHTVQTPAVVIHRAGTFHEVTQILSGQYHSRNIFFLPQLPEQFPQLQCRFDPLLQHDILILPLTDGQVESLLPLFDLLQSGSFVQKQLLLLCILEQLAVLLDSGIRPLTATARRTYIFDVVEAIRSMPEEKYTVASLAEQFHVSQSKLKSDFKQVTGQPVKVFHTRLRLQKAVTLLETTRLDQAQIACECGFSGESHLIEAFRKVYGVTPGAYRKQKN